MFVESYDAVRLLPEVAEDSYLGEWLEVTSVMYKRQKEDLD